MMIQTGRAYRVFVLSFAGAAIFSAAGCTTGGSPHEAGGQPRTAIYQCGEAGNIRIDSRGSTVVLTDQEQAQYEMAAAPPNQRSRYGAEGLALVVEGREALWMKAGQAPMTCQR